MNKRNIIGIIGSVAMIVQLIASAVNEIAGTQAMNETIKEEVSRQLADQQQKES